MNISSMQVLHVFDRSWRQWDVCKCYDECPVIISCGIWTSEFCLEYFAPLCRSIMFEGIEFTGSTSLNADLKACPWILDHEKLVLIYGEDRKFISMRRKVNWLMWRDFNLKGVTERDDVKRLRNLCQLSWYVTGNICQQYAGAWQSIFGERLI